MESKSVNAILDELFTNPKSKNFLNHLVRSYMPVSKVTKVIEKPKGDFRCAITKVQLISCEEILNGMQSEEFKAGFMAQIQSSLNENTKVESPLVKLLDGKQLAVIGKETNTYMSYPVFMEFYNWVVAKLLQGDKHIAWLLGDINRKEFLNKAQGLPAETKRREKRAEPKFKTATFSLGDMGVLQDLKKKLEQ